MEDLEMAIKEECSAAAVISSSGDIVTADFLPASVGNQMKKADMGRDPQNFKMQFTHSQELCSAYSSCP